MSWETGPMYSGPAPKRKPKRVRRPRDTTFAYTFGPTEDSEPRFGLTLTSYSSAETAKDARRLATWLTKAADWIDATRRDKGKA